MQQKNKLLLIVDDSTLIIRRLTRVLSEDLKSTNVISVLNGVDALNSIHSFKPSVVLLDIQLPDINGIEILKQIKNNYSNTVVIMLTNQSSPKVRQTCLSEGAEGFYDKTKDFQDAINHIKRLEE